MGKIEKKIIIDIDKTIIEKKMGDFFKKETRLWSASEKAYFISFIEVVFIWSSGK